MQPPLLPMPPAADSDLLQRWVSANPPHPSPARVSANPPHPSPARSPAAFVQRHASFDSPCQVPLPPDGYFPPHAPDLPADPADPATPRPAPFRTTLSTPIFPFSRPFSVPCPPPDDRFESASLPLPEDVPFHTLPRTADPAAHAARVRQAHLDDDDDLHSNPFAYPAPDPPTILPPTASPGPFLSHAPPPPDSSIEVDTSVSEYRLNVRLPGFKRDGITLATKKRRILHVVADCWENGGGHFERRISFGYDADLVQVRAEFDGEMLRISIPRRLPPVDLWRPAPIGRSG